MARCPRIWLERGSDAMRLALVRLDLQLSNQQRVATHDMRRQSIEMACKQIHDEQRRAAVPWLGRLYGETNHGICHAAVRTSAW